MSLTRSETAWALELVGVEVADADDGVSRITLEHFTTRLPWANMDKLGTRQSGQPTPLIHMPTPLIH